MPRKKKQTNSEYSGYQFPHFIDDENKVVYVYYRSWAGSMGAHTLGKKIWPDYEIKGVTKEKLEQIKKDEI